MATQPPLVSVIIPCFNAENTIARAIASVRAQDYPSVEIITVDDCSADNTVKILAEQQGAGEFRYVKLDRNSGAAAARNEGLRLARGEYIAFLDADDEWLPSKLSKQMALITARPAMSFVACGAGFIEINSRELRPLYGPLAPADGPEAWRVLLAYNFVATPAVVARRSLIDRVGGFNTSLVIGEDQDLWIRLALEGEVGYVPETLLVVHEQRTGLSRRNTLRLLEDSLPMVLRHVEAQRHRLSSQEVAHILGHRYAKIGRNAYLDFPFRGATLIVKAILRGHEPLENTRYLFTASVPARWLKRRLLNR